VYLFEQDYSVIPGPRFIAILEAVAKAIHPELEWK
jgi:ABC-type Fe3+-hydroxamate transport system substrate-binding protein